MRLSEHYEMQSMVDIGRAQAIARTDQSGHALGTAMYLAQQSVEKQLKSIVLRMDEAINLGSVDRVLRGLSHEFYPRLYELYYAHLEHDQLSMISRYEHMADLEDVRREVGSFASHFREASAYWDKYHADHRVQNLTWQQGLGIELQDEDMLEMNSLHKTQMKFVQDDTLGSGEPDLEFADSLSAPDRIRIDVMDRHALAIHRAVYASTPANSHTRVVLADTFEEASLFFLHGFKKHYAGMQVSEFAKKAIFEFGFRVLASMTHQYTLLYPHSAIGRYPGPVGGGLFSTDVYEKQASFVLAHLFVSVPHHLRVLCANSGLIGTLADRGRRLGYWGARPPGQRPRAGPARTQRDDTVAGRAPGRAVDAGALAVLYARQADSDLSHANAAARADRSGYALADAMLLGQQSLEKYLKAAVLTVAGMLGADGALDVFGARGHDVYRWVFGFYMCHVDRMHVSPAPQERGPGSPKPDPDGLALAIEGSADFWRGYSRDRGLQGLAWRRSIGVALDGDGASRLDAGLAPCAREAGILAGEPDMGIPRLAGEAAAGQLTGDELLCPDALAARRRAHMKSPWNSAAHAAVGRRFGECRGALSRGAREADGASKALRGRITAEFCLAALVMLAPGYLHAYPHNSLGRYPGSLGGCVTTDMYRSHADGVRSLLFVDIPCQAGQVARVAWLARRLWRGQGAKARDGEPKARPKGQADLV